MTIDTDDINNMHSHMNMDMNTNMKPHNTHSNPLTHKLNFDVEEEDGDHENQPPNSLNTIHEQTDKKLSSSSSSSSFLCKPKRIDFSSDTSQTSEMEPDLLKEDELSQNGLFRPDEIDYLTPQDQPVVEYSNPTSPSPLKRHTTLGS